MEDIKETLEGLVVDIPAPLLNYYILKANNYFLSTTNLTEVPATANFIIIDLVLIYYNKYGNEGIINSSNSGISINWGTDINNELKRAIGSYRCINW